VGERRGSNYERKDGEVSGSSESKRIFQLSSHKKVFGECWLAFLRIRLPLDIYKSVLSKIDSHIIPHMKNPLLLMDFLTSSYSTGGIISILSLNGIFILITQHNLDYPDFFCETLRTI